MFLTSNNRCMLLGNKRIPLPACAYHAITKTFHLDKEEFKGYKLSCWRGLKIVLYFRFNFITNMQIKYNMYRYIQANIQLKIENVTLIKNAVEWCSLPYFLYIWIDRVVIITFVQCKNDLQIVLESNWKENNRTWKDECKVFNVRYQWLTSFEVHMHRNFW